MKKYVIITTFALVTVASMDARHGWGWRRGGWGWGPGIGVGFTVPIGGNGYSAAAAAPYVAEDPYNKYVALFPRSNPIKNKDAYHRWLFSNYAQADAEKWWGYFINYRYNPYQASKPRPSAYFSVGTGYPYYGGYWGYPYYGGYWGRPWGWGRPYGGVGFSVGF